MQLAALAFSARLSGVTPDNRAENGKTVVMGADDDTDVTGGLIRSARGVTSGGLPDDVREVARHCLLDWFGCALGGVDEPLARILREQAGAGGGDEATLIGRPERATVLVAALVNGATSHALDFDDTHLTMSGHPSVPVVPAVLALAERDDRSGTDLLAAVVAGIELECRLGALVNPGHYLAGFHATGTLGTFGAAAAAAHLLGLDEARWRHALGLAGTQAAGLKSGFGTMAKPLHAGHAASDGLLSALLAGAGYTGNPAVIEADQGFAATHGPGLRPERLERLDDDWLIRQTLFKYHAACYLTHSSIEGAMAVRDELGDPATVDRVELRVAPSSLDVCAIAAPVTGLETKFSLRATAAMALLGDDMSDLLTYSDERAVAGDVVAMRDRVEVVPDPTAEGTRTRVVVSAGGRAYTAEVDVGVPATDLAQQWERLTAKFRALATPVLGADGAEALLQAVTNVEDASVSDLVAAAVPKG